MILSTTLYSTKVPIVRSNVLEIIEEEVPTTLLPILNKYGTEIKPRCNFNYANGSVTLTCFPNNLPLDNKTILHIDMLATCFFQLRILPFLQNWKNEGGRKSGDSFSTDAEHKDFIWLCNQLESMPYAKELQKITTIYYRTLERYILTNPDSPFPKPLPQATGLKFSHLLKDQNHNTRFPHGSDPLLTPYPIGDFALLSSKPGNVSYTVRSWLEKMCPKSIALWDINPIAARCFLEYGFSQKTTFLEQSQYLRQVLCLSVIKHAVKRWLESIRQEVENSLECCNFAYYSAHPNQELKTKLRKIEDALHTLKIPEPLFFISVACHSNSGLQMHLQNQDKKDEEEGELGFKPFSPLLQKDPQEDSMNFPLIFTKETLVQQKSCAEQAYILLVKLFTENLGIDLLSELNSPQKPEIEQIHRFLQGISSLAIPGGAAGRLALLEFSPNLPLQLRENLSYEFIITAAQHCGSSPTAKNWIEEGYLGYLHEILGELNPVEINYFQSQLQLIYFLIKQVPVENLMEEKENKFRLKDNAWEEICNIYENICKNLDPVSLFRQDKSCCTII